jgi:lysyl-tRNA synthetase class 2
MSDEEIQQAYRARLDNHLVEERHGKIQTLRETGVNPYPNGLEVTHTAKGLFEAHGDKDHEALEALGETVTVAGRLRFIRSFGKGAFMKIADRSVRPGIKPAFGETEPSDDLLQLFISKAEVGDEAFPATRTLDLGDTVWATGSLMRTRTGELSVKVSKIQMVSKSVRPLPEKFHGLQDVEQRQRMRYVDLIMNDESREVFLKRSQIVRSIRRYFDDREYIEVETPMMHVHAGGAAARPFETHHNALDMPLSLRIAPELYLKRLVVGGLERVYEMNRNFRNEGVSRQHNPEFTMLEFYQTYATYEDLMDMTEELVAELAQEICGTTEVEYQGQTISFARPWKRLAMGDAVAEKLGASAEDLKDVEWLSAQIKAIGMDPKGMDAGKMLFSIFEERCEDDLVQPTFVTQHPASVSPLARRNDDDPTVTDRFELYMAGKEIANGFSELNDPEDQHYRFAKQLDARAAGDDEAMPMDEDYIRALEYGMPPTAGEGIGIDRLVMILTNSASIRDVILFPHMRPE